MTQKIKNILNALHSLQDSILNIESVDQEHEDIKQAIERGYFRPQEDQRLWNWFARFLTVREGLWEIIDEVSDALHHDINLIEHIDDWRCLVSGYTAACLLARMDHFLIDDIAIDKLTQKKLNEKSPVHRVPRKQYTKIFRAFTDPDSALALLRVMTFLAVNQEQIAALEKDEVVGDLVQKLPEFERYVDASKRRYLKRHLRYRWHEFRRLFASARQRTTFLFLEQGGRFVSKVGDSSRRKRVRDRIRSELLQLLKPGDVIVTRHERVASNLFLPGYWPHCALYIGTENERKNMGIKIDKLRALRWSGDKSVLEALKDGVLFRPVTETLSVDAVAIVRPVLTVKEIAEGIERACQHEGKGYNFDFDFFRSDKLVCTEVVYRAYDDLHKIHFELQERAGRPTLSAEDILDMALEGEMFSPVAIFGAPGCRRKVVVGNRVRKLLAKSYK